MRGLLVIAFVVVVMASGSAFAIPFQTSGDVHYSSTIYPSVKLPGPQSVCDDTASRLSSSSSTYDYVCDSWTYVGSEMYLERTTISDGTKVVNLQGYLAVQCVDNTNGSYIDGVYTCPDQCTPPSTWNYSTSQCDVDCSGTVGQELVLPNPSSANIDTKQCSNSCEYSLSYYEIVDESFGFGHYIGNGQSCSTSGGSQPTPTPQTPDPITPTDPEPEIVDDGNTTPDPATDEGQEIISGQLGGIQSQLQNLEGGTSGLQQGQNTQTGILQQIANSLTGTGTGASGTGTGDQDGDGTDDFFTDGGCAGAPACNGPAIECAIAAQAYLTRCNLQDDTTDITEADVQAQVGTTETLEEYFDPTKPENIVDIDGIFVAPSEVSGSCPGDYSVTTSLGSISFSWSYVCDLGALVRPVMLLLAWVMVAFMFYSALLRDW